MIIATRTLRLRTKTGAVAIVIDIHAPHQISDTEWRCKFEIAWPDHKAERWGTGIDSVQALLFALQMIGTELYASKFHDDGQLIWESLGTGYGFPVPNNIRDLLVGDDRKYL